MWTPDEWWNANIDLAKAAELFADAGLPFLYWENRVPQFDGEVDTERVQEIAGQAINPPPPPPESDPEPPHPAFMRRYYKDKTEEAPKEEEKPKAKPKPKPAVKAKVKPKGGKAK